MAAGLAALFHGGGRVRRLYRGKAVDPGGVVCGEIVMLAGKWWLS
jgi:hypothetical protein